MKRWFLYVGLALFIGAFVNCGVVEGGTTKFLSPGFKLWGSYHYLSMSDWNSYKENVNDKQLHFDDREYYPSFHHGVVTGGEFSCLFMDMWGFGLGTGLISGDGVDYDDTYYRGGIYGLGKYEIEYKHSAKAIPLMLTLYYTPRVSLFRFVLGGGAGFYHAWTNFDYKDGYYENGHHGEYYRSYYHRRSDLSSNGLGIHGSVGLEFKEPETPVSIFAEVRLRHAKISGFKGEEDMYGYWESYDPYDGYEGEQTDTTYDVELIYEKDGKYFGPATGEKGDEVRDGVIDFSGFEFGIGIIFRF